MGILILSPLSDGTYHLQGVAGSQSPACLEIRKWSASSCEIVIKPLDGCYDTLFFHLLAFCRGTRRISIQQTAKYTQLLTVGFSRDFIVKFWLRWRLVWYIFRQRRMFISFPSAAISLQPKCTTCSLAMLVLWVVPCICFHHRMEQASESKNLVIDPCSSCRFSSKFPYGGLHA